MRVVKLFFLLFIVRDCCGQTKYQKDFEYYWNTVNDDFAYFDIQKADWKKVKLLYQPVADTISSNSSFLHFLERVNNELYNGHISLNSNLPSSNRLIPTGADLWVEYRGKNFVITATREDFNSDICGLKRGMKIVRYNGIPIDSAVRPYLPKSVLKYDNRMYEYAANMLLAGTHNGKRTITIRDSVERTFFPDTIPNRTASGYKTLIDYRVISGDIGHITINNSLGNFDLIKAFDDAIDSLWDTKGLIIDLRETPGGGNTTVARAIMSRFTTKEMPYQKHSLPAEEKQYGVKRSWVEWVSPRGRIYKKPVVVLTGRWTGSMGEGIAIGFDGIKRAQVAGDKMAGLLGAIYSYTMPLTGIGFGIPVEKLYHINGTPREQFVPEFLEPDNDKCINRAISLLRYRQLDSP